MSSQPGVSCPQGHPHTPLCPPLTPPAPLAPRGHLATVPAVLHVDPVVPVVPEALDAQEVVVPSAVAAARERVDEEALGYLALPRQHQDPAVHPQAVQGVGLGLLCLLHGKVGGHKPARCTCGLRGPGLSRG